MYRRWSVWVVLASLVDDLTTLVFDHLELAAIAAIEPACDMSHRSYKSLAQPELERSHEGWAYLVRLLLESWDAARTADPDLARTAAARWLALWRLHGHGLLLRLCLLAVAEEVEIGPEVVLEPLLARPLGMWHHEWRVELLRVIRLRGREMAPHVLTSLCECVMAGPPRSFYLSGITEEEFAQLRQRAADEHLGALHLSGAELPANIP